MNNGVRGNVCFFCAGILVGSAVVALTTPVTGRRLRRLLRHKVETGAEQIAHAAEGWRDGAASLYSRGQKIWRRKALA